MTFEEAVQSVGLRGRELGSGLFVGAQEISPVSEEEILAAGFQDAGAIMIGIALSKVMEEKSPEREFYEAMDAVTEIERFFLDGKRDKEDRDTLATYVAVVRKFIEKYGT